MLIEKLQEEQKRLEYHLLSAKRDMENAPEGSLRITHSGNLPELRHRQSKSDRSGTYIPKDQIHIAQALAQKGYAEKFIKTISPRLELLNEIIHEYESKSLEDVYNNLSAVRQQIVKPYVISDEEYARRWQAMQYEPNPKYPDEKDQETSKGEWVRSKSEVIIADNLKMMGIPYKYEAPVRIAAISGAANIAKAKYGPSGIALSQYTSTSDIIYPDFTCLNVKRRKLIYIEHFGILDSEGYRDKEFFWKIKNFENYGLIQGKNLLMTFEDDKHTFNFSNYKRAIEEMLIQ